MLPLARRVVVAVQLSSLCITHVALLNLVRLDDHDAKVLPRDRVIKSLDLGARLEVLLIVRNVSRLSGRRTFERSLETLVAAPAISSAKITYL